MRNLIFQPMNANCDWDEDADPQLLSRDYTLACAGWWWPATDLSSMFRRLWWWGCGD